MHFPRVCCTCAEADINEITGSGFQNSCLKLFFYYFPLTLSHSAFAHLVIMAVGKTSHTNTLTVPAHLVWPSVKLEKLVKLVKSLLFLIVLEAIITFN